MIFLNSLHIGEAELWHMVDEVQFMCLPIEQLQTFEMLVLQIPADDLQVFFKLLEGEVLFFTHGFDCRVLVGDSFRHASDETLVDELQLFG